MKKTFAILVAALLAACSTTPKIELVPGSSDKKTTFIIDDTRYYSTPDYRHSYTIKSDNFTPSPKHTLDIDLAEVLDTNKDAKAIRLKRLALSITVTEEQLSANSMRVFGTGIGGAMGAAMIGAAEPNDQASELQLVKCDFLARYNGRIIEFDISERACPEGENTCIFPDKLTNSPLDNVTIRENLKTVTHRCIAEALVRIKELKKLPPLAEAEQEKR